MLQTACKLRFSMLRMVEELDPTIFRVTIIHDQKSGWWAWQGLNLCPSTQHGLTLSYAARLCNDAGTEQAARCVAIHPLGGWRSASNGRTNSS